MIWRLVGVLALVALAGAALLLAAGRDEGAPALSTDPFSAERLVDSIGVNVHFGYADTAYANRAGVLARLEELGVGHVRDAAADGNPVLAAGLQAAARQGLRATLIADPAKDPATQVSASLAAMGDRVESFEGPNELDDGRDPAWAATLGALMPALESALSRRAPRTTLLGPSFINSGSRVEVGSDLPGLYNAHPYAGGDRPEPALVRALEDRAPALRRRATVFTEAGYHGALASAGYHTPVSDRAAAVYLPRLLLTAFGAGVRRTFIYELVDGKPDPGLVDPQQHFGLLRNDLSPKPAFTAVRTLIGALRSSPGPPVSELPSFELGSDPPELEHLTLRRADGSMVIALWRAVSVWDVRERMDLDPGRVPVELSLGGREARDVEVWRPSVSPLPVRRLDRASRVALALEGDLALVSLR